MWSHHVRKKKTGRHSPGVPPRVQHDTRHQLPPRRHSPPVSFFFLPACSICLTRARRVVRDLMELLANLWVGVHLGCIRPQWQWSTWSAHQIRPAGGACALQRMYSACYLFSFQSDLLRCTLTHSTLYSTLIYSTLPYFTLLISSHVLFTLSVFTSL